MQEIGGHLLSGSCGIFPKSSSEKAYFMDKTLQNGTLGQRYGVVKQRSMSVRSANLLPDGSRLSLRSMAQSANKMPVPPTPSLQPRS